VAVLDDQSEMAVSGHDRPFVENRLVGKALKFWETVRDGRDLPSTDDLSSSECPFGPSETMVIEVGTTENDDTIVAAGEKITLALGVDPTGLGALEALPSSTEMGLSFCRASVDLKKPMADVGRFFNRKGEEVLYRSILLPLSDDGQTVNRVVSAFSYKIVH